ncbi:hypothetical protein ACFFK0_21960 [Paenibacillus chartarius]|uniref:Uncharacterized protein n=1 Tax=Paenibacillus chartarius TaxID=747481 RepID=A0ABV6DR02_9BACL
MPFVLKHRETAQIYTCILVNHYQLAYYGVKFWEQEEAAREEASAWLEERAVAVGVRAGVPAESLVSLDPAEWDVVELSEPAMKMGNVKLKNDPSYRLVLDADGRPVAERVGG